MKNVCAVIALFSIFCQLSFAMVKCPFCAFSNEDGALFCEQCKSDLGHQHNTVSIPTYNNLSPVIGKAGAMPGVAVPTSNTKGITVNALSVNGLAVNGLSH